MLPQTSQATQTPRESAAPKTHARPKKNKDSKKAKCSWAYRAWVGRGAARDERGRWRTCKDEFRSAMASSDAARVGDMAAIMEVRHGISRPLKRPRERSPEIKRFGRQRLRALRVGGAIPATRPHHAISRADLTDFRLAPWRELQDLHHTRGRQLRASCQEDARHARQRESEDLAALQQWRDKCAKALPARIWLTGHRARVHAEPAPPQPSSGAGATRWLWQPTCAK